MAVDFSALDAVIEHMDHVDYSAWSASPRCTLRTLPFNGVKVPRAVLVRRVHAVYVRRPQG